CDRHSVGFRLRASGAGTTFKSPEAPGAWSLKPEARSPTRSFDVDDPVDTSQRLDHLLQVLDVADLHRHVNSSGLIVVGASLDVADVGVDPRDLRGHVGENTLAVLDLQAEANRGGCAG